MKLTLYEYPKCGTCRDTVKWLKAKGHELESRNIFEKAPGKRELKKLIKNSKLELKNFFNTSGEVYKEMQLKDKIQGMSDEEKIALLTSNGRLIKRPIVTDGTKVTVGFKEEEFEKTWGNSDKIGQT